jgi:tetratricopeptide (TPR) repeat protein
MRWGLVTKRRVWFAGVIAALSILAASGGAYVGSLNEHRFRSRLEGAKALLLETKPDAARRILRELAGDRPGDWDVLYHLGLAEQARGRPEAAVEVWSRIPMDAPQGGLARFYQARVAIQRGQLARGEDLLKESLRATGPQLDDARWELVKLLRVQGRFEEAKRLFGSWLALDEELPAKLKLLYKLDDEPIPVERLRLALGEAGRREPQDDRVWLARGHLALVQGKVEEADRWFSECARARPDDPAVCRLRLQWAIAAGRADVVWDQLGKISVDPEEEESRLEVLRIAAWLAGQGEGRSDETRLLERILELRPLDAATLERLATLATERGEIERAAEFRLVKQQIDPIRQEYEGLLTSPNPAASAARLGTLALELGRPLEAKWWSLLAGSGEGSRHGEKTRSVPISAASKEVRTLRDLVVEVLGGPGGAVAGRGSQPTLPGGSADRFATVWPRFSDDAANAGLRFTHRNGDVDRRLIPPVTGSGGVALLDYDGDGWMDVFVVQSGEFPAGATNPEDGDRLFHNRGDGTFEDATAQSGLGSMKRGYGHGAAVGDYDNDGDPDLFVTRWRGYALYRNRGDGTFEDATIEAGLGGDRDWPTSAAFADFDNDGDLDLYVCHYMKWDETDERPCSDPDRPEIYRCSPINFPALPDHLFRNDSGRFVDVTADSGIIDQNGRGLGVLAADLNDDGRIDLFVANDMTADALLLNQGNLRFEEVGHLAGVAGNASGAYQAGMGVAAGDLNGDGRIDLVVTNFYNEGTTYFQNLGQGLFADRSEAIGIHAPSRFLLGFGVALLDVNNDGRLDLVSANGHVNDGRPSYPWKMPAQLLLGQFRGRMLDAGKSAGAPFGIERLGRGLAAGDLDNDGRIDVLLQSQNEPLAYFHNQTTGPGRFVRLRLEGRQSNRDGIGARVVIRAGELQLVAERFGGGSYQSANDPRLHFGLGTAQRIDELTVSWPSGQVDRYHELAVDREYLLREGEPVPLPGPGGGIAPAPILKPGGGSVVP